jgi:hypothetical protein
VISATAAAITRPAMFQRQHAARPQRSIVAGRDRSDQFTVVHCFSLLRSGGNKFTGTGKYANTRSCVRASRKDRPA